MFHLFYALIEKKKSIEQREEKKGKDNNEAR